MIARRNENMQIFENLLMNNTLLLILFGLLIVLVGAVILIQKHKNQNDGLGKVNTVSKNKDPLHFLIPFFSHTPGLKRLYYRIRRKIQIIYPADPLSMNRKISALLMEIVVIGISGLFLAIWISKGNIFFLCSILLVVYVFITQVITNNFQKMEINLLTQFSNYLDILVHYYHKRHVVDYAMKSAMEHQPYEITLHIQRLCDIIAAPPRIMNQKISEYTGTEPNRFFLLFLSTCASTRLNGDKSLSESGSLFLSNIHILKEELNEEILSQDKNRKTFKGLTNLCLIIILLIKPFQNFILKNMPAMTTYFEGLYGTVTMLVVFLVAIVCYEIVMILIGGEANNAKMREDSIWVKISKLPFLAPFLRTLESRRYTHYLNINDSLRFIGDHTGPRAFILKKFVFAIATFLVCNVVLTSAVVTEKTKALKDFAGAFENEITPSAEYTQWMEEAAAEYALAIKKGQIKEVDIQSLANNIMTNTKVQKINYAMLVASSVLEHLNDYYQTYYKFYYLLISFALAGGAYFIPDLFLKFKGKNIILKKEEEVMQFQSLMLMLMHSNGITIKQILEWLERFSYCFKQTLAQCRVSLYSGTAAALEQMKVNEIKCESFCHFVDNLLDIDTASVEKAFAELESDRTYNMKKRAQNAEFSLQDRSNAANIIALIPFMTVIVGYILIPTGMYAFNMFSMISAFTK